MPTVIDADNNNQKKITAIMYGLQALSAFCYITGIAAIIINYMERNNVVNTIYASHFKWLRRTFWYSLLWAAIGVVTWIFFIGMAILALNTIWVIYRVIKGWLILNKDMPISY